MRSEVDFILGIVTGVAVMGVMTAQSNLMAVAACIVGGVFAAGAFVFRYLKKE